MKKSTKSAKPAAPQAKSEVKSSVEPAPAKKTVAPKKIPTPRKAVTMKVPLVPVYIEAAAPAVAEPPTITTIVAQTDVGFGNQLYLRGEGPGLSWDKGLPLSCVANDRWSLTVSGATRPIVFKLLLNDLTWSSGEDYTVAPGDTFVVTPSF